ncbi:MAG: NlpC/P60 family protein [Pseudomonadota bacterium]
MVELNDKRIAVPAEAAPVQAVIGRPNSPLMGTADGKARRVSSAVMGEQVAVYGQQGDFSLIRHSHDHYVGLAKTTDLRPLPERELTHWVCAPMAYAFSEPDLKSAPKTTLFLGSRLIITERDNGYNYMDGVGWIVDAHVLPLGEYLSDPADVAFNLMGSPYLWGGRDRFGIDCSGLTQIAYAACGTRLPRDSDMQFAWSGMPVENWSHPGALQRGDLVFWRGHVGIMLNENMLIHANGYAMSVALEPLAQAVERIAEKTEYGRPIGAKRIQFPDPEEPDWYRN